MYTITLSDNTVLRNLTVNGDFFISNSALTPEDFDGKLATVIINDGEGEIKTLTDCALFDLYVENGKTWFFIAEKTPKMKQDELNADLELALTELYELIIGG